jgi:hypothetical protein
MSSDTRQLERQNMFNIKVTAPERCQKSKSHGAILDNIAIIGIYGLNTYEKHMWGNDGSINRWLQN